MRWREKFFWDDVYDNEWGALNPRTSVCPSPSLPIFWGKFGCVGGVESSGVTKVETGPKRVRNGSERGWKTLKKRPYDLRQLRWRCEHNENHDFSTNFALFWGKRLVTATWNTTTRRHEVRDPQTMTWSCDVGYKGTVAERCDSCTQPVTWWTFWACVVFLEQNIRKGLAKKDEKANDKMIQHVKMEKSKEEKKLEFSRCFKDLKIQKQGRLRVVISHSYAFLSFWRHVGNRWFLVAASHWSVVCLHRRGGCVCCAAWVPRLMSRTQAEHCVFDVRPPRQRHLSDLTTLDLTRTRSFSSVWGLGLLESSLWRRVPGTSRTFPTILVDDFSYSLIIFLMTAPKHVFGDCIFHSQFPLSTLSFTHFFAFRSLCENPSWATRPLRVTNSVLVRENASSIGEY